MTAKVTQKEINDKLWTCCDVFRGNISANVYKDYILVMLFVKYLSDIYESKEEKLIEKYKGDMAKVDKIMARERFSIPKGTHFKDLYAKREESNIGEIIQTALKKIEESNIEKLEGIFRNVDFDDARLLGDTTQRQRIIQDLLVIFNSDILNLRPEHVGNLDVIGNAYEYLIGKFAAGAGASSGEYYTPPEVSTLMAKILQPKVGDRICDPTCGSGSLLLKCAKEIKDNLKSDDFSLYGQENVGETYALCRMNMYLHEVDNAEIKWGDTIRTPKLLENDKLMKFNIVTANPPFSLDKWGADNAANDKFGRFHRGIPPKSKGDYAFVTHMIETLDDKDGRMTVVVPHGVLFRGSSEGKIRKKFVEDNLLDTVIGLPANLFFGTGIPAVILVFKKNKKNKDILFIDASKGFEDNKNQNKLRESDIDKILSAYSTRENQDKYSYLATFEEVKDNEFNLNIPRYVDTFEEEEEVDLSAVQEEISKLEQRLFEIQKKMKSSLTELGL
ncbi:MAG: type I restriction-modification system subunit M [Halobacteriovoraceae bacterium]|nr:type I restriction-modification system subunit M [Halobacteriovoraceae bacterium]